MDSFQRNGSPETSIWKTNTDNFQGCVRAKLEDLEKTQEAQWKEHYVARKKIGNLERNAQYQLGGISVLYIIATLVLAAFAAGIIHLGGI